MGAARPLEPCGEGAGVGDAQDAKTLRMAGRMADGAFIRAGVHPVNLRLAAVAIREGERQAGRRARHASAAHSTPCTVTMLRARRIGRAVTAGYHEHSTAVFANLGLSWQDEPVGVWKRRVWRTATMRGTCRPWPV